MSSRIWAFGSNGSGQLGLGHKEDVSEPQKCCFSDGRTAVFDRPCSFAAGGNHSLILCEDGTLYAAGLNGDGRCGSQPQPPNPVLNKVWFKDENKDLVDRFKLCAATWEASTFVTIDNKVYSCGTGNKGELGQGVNVTDSQRPRLLEAFPPAGISICQLASSIGHTIAILSNGEVYGWGSGRKGQLGAPSADAWKPKKIMDVSFMPVAAACGRECTFLVGASDEGKYVVIGSDKWALKTGAPECVQGWQSIGANWSGLHVLLATGQIVSWGRNNHGQLCPDTAPLFRQMVSGSEHVIAKKTENKIVAWGWGEHGNCGGPTGQNEDYEPLWNHISVPENFALLGAGCATSWLVQTVCSELETT